MTQLGPSARGEERTRCQGYGDHIGCLQTPEVTVKKAVAVGSVAFATLVLALSAFVPLSSAAPIAARISWK